MQYLIALVLLFALIGGDFTDITTGPNSGVVDSAALTSGPVSFELSHICTVLLTGLAVVLGYSSSLHYLTKRNTKLNQKMIGILQTGFWVGFSLVLTLGIGWTELIRQTASQWSITFLTLTLTPHVSFLCFLWIGTDWAFPYREKPWTISSLKKSTESLGVRFQHFILPILLPLLIAVVTKQTLEATSFWSSLQPLQQTAVFGGISLLLISLLLPSVICQFWTTEKITEKDPDRRLLEFAKDLNLKISSVSIWKTGYRVANAVVIGCVPFVRKILITDVVIKIMNKSELEGIFFHEAGHIKKNHTFWRVLSVALPFVIGLVLIQAFQFDQLSILEWSYIPNVQGLCISILLILFTMGLFNVVSHQLELEADRFAVSSLLQKNKETDDIVDGKTLQTKTRLLVENYCNALRKTIEVSEGNINQSSLAHPSVMQRIVHLKQAFLSTNDRQTQETNFLFLLKGSLLLSVVASGILFLSTI